MNIIGDGSMRGRDYVRQEVRKCWVSPRGLKKSIVLFLENRIQKYVVLSEILSGEKENDSFLGGNPWFRGIKSVLGSRT